jgi:AcrR family transcriptional regulator
MSRSANPTRQRLMAAAIVLFQAQGITETTTKQIAERAEVNEVTLFRQFGSKQGLLLAILQEAAVVTQMGQALIAQSSATDSIYPAVKSYAAAYLEALERSPDVVRSVVGGAGQYPSESRKALGAGLNQANQSVADYFQSVIDRGQLEHYLSAGALASLLNSLLLGYAVLELTSEDHELWQDREAFLEDLVTLFLRGAVSPLPGLPELGGAVMAEKPEKIVDLTAAIAHEILQRSKKEGLQAYALAYVLFGAGLSPEQLVRLERSDYLSDRDLQFLQVGDRQVPVNQWILGKRYGSYAKNPLTQWLKSRKDDRPALFLGAAGEALSETELRQDWQNWTADLLMPGGQPPSLTQVPQTWCVEMLMKGMSLTDLQILTGWEMGTLQACAYRVREKAALDQAMRLDRNKAVT